MPRGKRKGSDGRGRDKGKSPPEHKDSASDGAALSDDQTLMAAASSDKTKMSSQTKAKVKSAKAARKPRPANAESQQDEMSDIVRPLSSPPFLPHTLQQHVILHRPRSLQRISPTAWCQAD